LEQQAMQPFDLEEVSFVSQGLRCAATLYRPRSAEVRQVAVPGVVMGPGFASVRQMNLPDSAAVLASAGLAVLTVDYRYLGQSQGEPRQQVRPREQREDLRNALTWLADAPGIDPDRMGLWGTSFAAGHVLQVAALDRRVKAVVSQVPGLGLWPYLRGQGDGPAREDLLNRLLADRLARHRTGVSRRLPIVARDGIESVLGSSGVDWHDAAERAHPTFHNEILMSSLDDVVDEDPAAFAPFITPTPLLMIVAERDNIAPPGLAYAAFEAAGQPKRLLTYDGDHYDVYDVPATLRLVSTAARDFYLEHFSH